MTAILKKTTTILKHPVAIIIMGIAFFITYDKLSARGGSIASGDGYVTDRSSVTFVGEKYKVDSLVIRKDLNKMRLIAEVEKQVLEQKKTIQQVPSFIWRFLDSISSDRKFEIVNPGEDWKEGITDYGHVIFKKVYNPDTQDSVPMLSGDGAILPNKLLVYFGMSNTIVLMSYMHGGLGPHPNIMIMKHQNNKVTDFWYGSSWNDGIITSKSEIIKTLKSKRQNGC
jgi:hypothetical protein